MIFIIIISDFRTTGPEPMLKPGHILSSTRGLGPSDMQEINAIKVERANIEFRPVTKFSCALIAITSVASFDAE